MRLIISRTIFAAVIGLAMGMGQPAWAADVSQGGKLQSLRGETPIDQTPEADTYRPIKDARPLPRDFVQQPPLIPHSIRDYQVTKNFNKCMDCHSWRKAREANATRVSVTHFKTREGQELSNIAPNRYFCTQCHVPQADAKPLVENTFRPGVGLQ